jgi:hypothetical protein
MATFKIAYEYTLVGTIEVEAETLEAAKDLALEASVGNIDNEHYLDDSFVINEETTAALN